MVNLAVYIPQRQRAQLKAKGIAALVDGYRGFRIWPEQLAGSAPRSVMLFRGWMISDLIGPTHLRERGCSGRNGMAIWPTARLGQP